MHHDQRLSFCYTEGVNILDFIFPKYCVNCKKLGSYLCSDCFSYLSFDIGGMCVACNRASVNGITHPSCVGTYTIDGVFTGIEYKGITKKLIYNFKYKPYFSDLKNLLVDLLYEGIIQNESFSKVYKDNRCNLLLVSIPLHPSKFRARGYNQSEALAKGLSAKLNLPLINLLKRIKRTSSQVGLERKKRIKNISGAFSVVSNPATAGSKNANIFLVDDVLTTGSTLLEAANVLKRNGARKVWGIALARD